VNLKVSRNYLEIESLENLKSTNKPNLKCKIELLDPPNFKLNQFFYKQIGKDHRWIDRLEWSDQKWINYAENKNFNKIKLSQKKALIQALKNKKISFREFEINKSNESTLGELFGYFMLETVFLGKALGVDPYNQPAVEEVKILTKKNLI